jgi:hypothetical protein
MRYVCYLEISNERGLLTHSWRWALLEKPPILPILKNFPTFYGIWRFITVFTRVLQRSLSWARSIQSIPSHLISLRCILILSTHHSGFNPCFPSAAIHSGRAVWYIKCLRSLERWDRWFESHSRHGFLSAFIVFVVPCVGSSLATGWSSVQGILPTVLGLRNALKLEQQERERARVP